MELILNLPDLPEGKSVEVLTVPLSCLRRDGDDDNVLTI